MAEIFDVPMLWATIRPLEALIAVLAGTGLLLAASSYRKYRSDLRALSQAVRVVLRSGRFPERLTLYTRLGEHVRRSLIMLSMQTSEAHASKVVYTRALASGALLAEASDEEARAAKALCKLLLREMAPDAIAAAVILQERGEEARVVHSEGLAGHRTETALLSCFDAACDPRAGSAAWGYLSPELGPWSNFSSFGVGLCLLLPLRAEERLCGAVWLGFRRGATSLSPERKEFLRAIGEHAAGSFRAAARAKALTERVGREKDLLLGMSHDMRAPGNRALYHVRELLSEGANLTGTQRDELHEIEAAITEQLELVGDALDYAKHQKGILQAKLTRVPLRRAIEGALLSAGAQAQRKGLVFRADTLPAVTLFADARHVRRMISNLLSNAIKYTETGEVAVRVVTDERSVALFVDDTGCGIAPEDQTRLFQQFHRGANAEVADGVGLGLALTKVLAELGGGRVSYEPRPGGGSIFGIELPRAGDDDRLGNEEVSLDRVLVLDDDPAACRTHSRMLNGLARSCVPATTLEAAEELYVRIRPDAVVSDLAIGGSDASAFIERIAKEVPVLVISGQTGLSPFFPRAGVRFLEKPVERSAVRSALSELVSSVDHCHDRRAREEARPRLTLCAEE